MRGEDLVRDYLRRLEADARRLPDDRRAELVSEVREHIGIALAEAGAGDEATVRTVLERLSSPATIVTRYVGCGMRCSYRKTVVSPTSVRSNNSPFDNAKSPLGTTIVADVVCLSAGWSKHGNQKRAS